MKNIIGIRLEDKNKWERRTPIIPKHMQELKEKNIEFIVQSSSIRVYSDKEYKKVGVNVTNDLDGANIIFAIKEIPIPVIESFKEPKTLIFFSHTIKGQKHNMPMLKKIIQMKSTLIDYEKVLNEKGLRLIFFGNWAGFAGLFEILWGYGRRIKAIKKISSPFLVLKHTYEYEGLDEAKRALTKAGEVISKNGLPNEVVPFIIGFAGYGNVSKGAQLMLDHLPVKEIEPEKLIDFYKSGHFSSKHVYKVVFKEEHMVEPISGKFELQDYYKYGKEKYRGVFEQYIPFLSILINAIFWSDKYPRLISKQFLKESYLFNKEMHLKIIGDISCDIEGGIEATLMPTKPDNPVFIYNPYTDSATLGVEGEGIAIMAVDNLPCELPTESSTSFSETLKPFIPIIAKTDYSKNFEQLDLPPVIKNAVITHQGEFTPNYKYLEKYIEHL